MYMYTILIGKMISLRMAWGRFFRFFRQIHVTTHEAALIGASCPPLHGISWVLLLVGPCRTSDRPMSQAEMTINGVLTCSEYR